MDAGTARFTSVRSLDAARRIAGSATPKAGHAQRATSTPWLAPILLVIAIAAVSGPMLHGMLQLKRGDYAAHVTFAVEMQQLGHPHQPHFLFHGLLLAVEPLIPSEWMGGQTYHVAGGLVALAFYELLGLVVYLLLLRALPERRLLSSLIAAGLALAILFVTPMALFVFIDGLRYMGYVGINVWHNPTMVLLKPLALLLFLQTAATFTASRGTRGWGSTLAAAALTILSALAKPSYLLCLLPGAAIFALFRRLRGKDVDGQWLVMGIWLPGCLVLLGQYALNYTGEHKESLAFGPLVFWEKHSAYLLPKFLLSVVLPVVVYALYLGDARRDTGLNLAWVGFGCSLLWAYLVIEAGRPGAGNLSWSAQASLFVLFVISVRFLVQRTCTAADWTGGWPRVRALAAWIAFACHLGFGVYYYGYILANLVDRPGVAVR